MQIVKIFLVLLLFRLFLYSQSIESELRNYLNNIPIDPPNISVPKFPDRTFNLRDFGAVGDGKTLNTQAINNAIKSCSESGGGVVVVPAGIWLTGSIKLESNVNLKLDKGAFIQFSKDIRDFPVIPRFDDKSKKFVISPPIYSVGANNIAITGEGIIDGAGEVWRPVKKEKQTERQWRRLVESGGVVDSKSNIWWPSKEAMEAEKFIEGLGNKLTLEDVVKAREYFRPDFVRLSKSRGILIDGVTFLNSPRFHLHFVQSENIIVRNVRVYSNWWGQNTDGIDLSACRDVIIYKSVVDVGDDGICIKPSKIASYQKEGPACERILIADCIVHYAHGGFVVGSEGLGGARNIYVNNCTFIGTDVGLRFKSARDRGGLVENIIIENITMRDIKTQAILFDMYYESGSPEKVFMDDLLLYDKKPITKTTPMFQNITIKNVNCIDANRSVLINGLAEMPVKNIRIENSTIKSKKGAGITNADSIFIIKSYIQSDATPVFTISQSENIFLNSIEPVRDDQVLIKVKGDKTKNIILENTFLKELAKQIIISDKASNDAFIYKKD